MHVIEIMRDLIRIGAKYVLSTYGNETLGHIDCGEFVGHVGK
jgi:hypothetical protein